MSLKNPTGAAFSTIAEAKKAVAIFLGYGNLLNNIALFVIVAFAICPATKWVNRFTRLEGANLPQPQ